MSSEEQAKERVNDRTKERAKGQGREQAENQGKEQVRQQVKGEVKGHVGGQGRGSGQENDRAAAVELVVSRWLRAGVMVSGSVILAGLLFFIVAEDSGYPGATFPTSLKDILAGVMGFKPYAIIMAGLFLLILTPVLRVAISLLVFLAEKDYLYVLLTSFVFITLIISFFL